MGGNGSKSQGAMSTGGGSTTEEAMEVFDWGAPPDGPPEDENDILELVLTSWANCRSKPSPAGLYKSDDDEKHRREQVGWRKRTSFVELNCGEDSFFVSNTYKTVGVADGVGGWRDEGVDAAAFSNDLMKYSKHYSETHRNILNPEAILEKAFERIKGEKKIAAGSATACLASLSKERDSVTKAAKYFLDIANVGDSGAMVIRNREMVFRMHEKVHGMNAPYQLSVLPDHLKDKAYSDSVSDAAKHRVEVKEGDVVLLATDGIFDNRFNTEIVENVGWVGDVHQGSWDDVPFFGAIVETLLGNSWKIDYSDPYRVAQREVNLAYKASLNKDGHTPWSSTLKKFGVDGAAGGKVDDMTLVLCRITTRDEARRATLW